MITMLEQLIKILTAVSALFKDVQKDKSLIMLICSVSLNFLLVGVWYKAETSRTQDQKDFRTETLKKDSLFNTYLMRVNEELIKEKFELRDNIRKIDTLAIIKTSR